MKLIEYTRTIINLDPKTLSNDAKLVLIFMIAEAECSGVWRVDKEKYLESFGKHYSKSWISQNLGFWVQYLDNERVLIPGYVFHKYGKHLNNIDNPNYNLLNPLRVSLDRNRLSVNTEKSEISLIPL